MHYNFKAVSYVYININQQCWIELGIFLNPYFANLHTYGIYVSLKVNTYILKMTKYSVQHTHTKTIQITRI